MKKRPNAIWHMMKWGAGSGFVLALLYIIVVVDMFEAGFSLETLGILFTPVGWYLAFIFGAVPGAVMGTIVGTGLWWMMRQAPSPFTKADLIAKRPKVYGITAILTFLMSLFLIVTFFGLSFFNFFDFLLLGIPALIAAIASAYAAHRYMFRMRLWSGGIETHKTKAKNDALVASRLSDNASDNNHFHDDLQTDKTQSEQIS